MVTYNEIIDGIAELNSRGFIPDEIYMNLEALWILSQDDPHNAVSTMDGGEVAGCKIQTPTWFEQHTSSGAMAVVIDTEPPCHAFGNTEVIVHDPNT